MIGHPAAVNIVMGHPPSVGSGHKGLSEGPSLGGIREKELPISVLHRTGCELPRGGGRSAGGPRVGIMHALTVRSWSSGRKVGEERRRHLCRQVLEQSNGTRDVALAQMDQDQVQHGESPIRHDFDELAGTNEVWLDHRRQIPHSQIGKEGRCYRGEVVHPEMRGERNHLPVASVHVRELPMLFVPPIGEGDQAVAEKVRWR